MLRSQQVVLLCLQFFIHNALPVEAIGYTRTKNTSNNSDWKCESNDECTATNSSCLNNVCQCASEYIFNADMTACIKVATRLFDSCEETVQCSAYLFNGAKCINNVCMCGPGHYYLHGRCNRYVGLNEKCKRDVDCYVNADFEASVCNNGRCKCSPGFYQREYRTCRRQGKKPGDECTIDKDCTFGNVTCSRFVCTQQQSVEEVTELDLTLINNDRGTKEKIRVDDKCKTNEDCQALENASCSPAGTCRCNRAHFAFATGTKCIPELGEPCRKGSQNYIEKSFCREGRWSCTNGTVVSKNNRECLKATRKYNGQCKYDEQCYILGPDAVCGNKEKCVCNETVSRYIDSELFCWTSKGVDESCERNRDCYVKGFKGELMCKNNTCSCPDGTHLSRNKMACLKGGTGLGGVCEENDNCVTLNSVCKREMCSCNEHYYELNGKCLAGVNAACVRNEDCIPKNSVCLSNVCSCEPNYVSEAVDSCVQLSSYGEPCSLDVQCSGIPGAICANKQVEETAGDTAESPETGESNVCTCSEDSYYKSDRCLKKRYLDETCTSLNECYESVKQNRIICMNGKCACNWGYMKWNSSVCVSDPHGSAFFLNNSTTNIHIVSTGLFLIILFSVLL